MSPYLSVRSTSSTSDFRRCEVQAAQFRAQQLRLRLQACRSGVKKQRRQARNKETSLVLRVQALGADASVVPKKIQETAKKTCTNPNWIRSFRSLFRPGAWWIPNTSFALSMRPRSKFRSATLEGPRDIRDIRDIGRKRRASGWCKLPTSSDKWSLNAAMERRVARVALLFVSVAASCQGEVQVGGGMLAKAGCLSCTCRSPCSATPHGRAMSTRLISYFDSASR